MGTPGPLADAALLRALLEHASDMVSVVDADGRLVFHYPHALLGYDPGENLGRSVADFVHPDDVELAADALARAWTVPGPIDPVTVRIRHASGAWRSMRVVASNLVDDPAVGGLVLNAHDVTDHERAIRDLKRSEERFRSLVQHASELIIVWDIKGTITYASPATVRFVAGSDSAPVSDQLDHASMFFHPDDLERVQQEILSLFDGARTTGQFRARIRRHDGEYRWLDVTVSNRFRDPSIRGVVANARDVTDEIVATEAVEAREQWFRSLVQHGYDMIVVLDAGGTIAYASPSVRSVLGFDPDRLEGAHAEEFVHPDWNGRDGLRFDLLAEAPGRHGPVEIRAKHADGSWRDLELVSANLLDDPVVQGVVINLRDITDRKAVEAQLAHQAMHDPLTGLPNRNLLLDRMELALTRAHRDAGIVGVVFLDLDRFKQLNDGHGHAAGDALLVAVAERLAVVTRGADTVARFGGDEFVVVLDGMRTREAVVEATERLCEEIERPFLLGDTEVVVTASAGIALGSRESPATLLRDADAAMYHAKQQGGGTISVFEESIRTEALRRFETERSLRLALSRDEMRIVYQPVVSLVTGRAVAVEALVRWQHPRDGLLAPDHFIDLAEETGLIVPIGEWVLRGAIRQVAEWRRAPATAHLELAVNVSAAQLLREDLARIVEEAIADARIPPAALTLEITEGSLVDDATAARTTLRALDELGVHLVLDDFGMQYSSLSYLERMPIDGLKIDRAFVAPLATDAPGTAIVTAILAMADALKLSVVAEGVERAAQRSLLLELGCDLAQGYHFARPMPADDLAPRLDRAFPAASGS